MIFNHVALSLFLKCLMYEKSAPIIVASPTRWIMSFWQLIIIIISNHMIVYIQNSCRTFIDLNRQEIISKIMNYPDIYIIHSYHIFNEQTYISASVKWLRQLWWKVWRVSHSATTRCRNSSSRIEQYYSLDNP